MIILRIWFDIYLLFRSYSVLKLSLSLIAFWSCWLSLKFCSVRHLMTLLSSFLVISWYFNECCILVSHFRHSGHLDGFELDDLMISIISISPTGLVGFLGGDFLGFGWIDCCFALIDSFAGDNDLLLLLSLLSFLSFG